MHQCVLRLFAVLLLCGSAMAQQTEGAKNAQSTAADQATAAAGADVPIRRVAVLSVIGDKLGIVFYRGETGTNLSSSRQLLNLPEPALDKTALIAANEVLRKAKPRPGIALLMPTANIYAAQGNFLHEGRFTAPAELAAAFQEQNASHLLLITKYRAPASIKTQNGFVGSGMLEGLGYYVDYVLQTERGDTRETGTGFLAPYTYFRVSFIDLATSKVISEQIVASAMMISAARSKTSVDPWATLTPAEKIEGLSRMVQQGVSAAVPKLL